MEKFKIPFCEVRNWFLLVKITAYFRKIYLTYIWLVQVVIRVTLLVRDSIKVNNMIATENNYKSNQQNNCLLKKENVY